MNRDLLRSTKAPLTKYTTKEAEKRRQAPTTSQPHYRPLGARPPAIGLFFPRATFFGQARVPHVVQTGENSQNTDKHTEHLQRQRNGHQEG